MLFRLFGFSRGVFSLFSSFRVRYFVFFSRYTDIRTVGWTGRQRCTGDCVHVHTCADACMQTLKYEFKVRSQKQVRTHAYNIQTSKLEVRKVRNGHAGFGFIIFLLAANFAK